MKEKEKLEERLQKLDAKRSQLMKAAERKCGIAPMKGMFWYSNALRKAAQTLSDIKRKIRWQYKNNADENIIKNSKR